MSILKHSLVKGTKKVFNAETFATDSKASKEMLEMLSRNLAASGLNGKNIILTGQYEVKDYEIGTRNGKYLSLECLFFNDKDIANAKLGQISARNLTNSVVPVTRNEDGEISVLPENSGNIRQIEFFAEYSILDAVQFLTTEKDGKRPYLKATDKKEIFRVDFVENVETKRNERVFPQKEGEYLTRDIYLYDIDYLDIPTETTK